MEVLAQLNQSRRTPSYKLDLTFENHDNQNLSLCQLLTTRRCFGATDPRDLVFGLLGIAQDTEKWQRHLKVNYEAAYGHIYG